MAASAFQSTTVERAPITAVLPTGTEPSLGIAGLLFPKIGARLRRRLRIVQAELVGLIRAGHDSLRSGSTLNKE
jgi:hypothetical protein